MRPSLKANIFLLFGLFSEKLPDLLRTKAQILFGVELQLSEFELFQTKKQPELVLLAGCIRGLSHMIHGIENLVTSESLELKRIYKIIRLTIDPPEFLSRYDCVKGISSILIISCFGVYFSQLG